MDVGGFVFFFFREMKSFLGVKTCQKAMFSMVFFSSFSCQNQSKTSFLGELFKVFYSF